MMKNLFNTSGRWKLLAVPAFAFAIASNLSGCNDAATIASENIKDAARNFKIQRDVVFYNILTGEYPVTLKGRCNIEIDAVKDKLDVTCKHGPDDVRNHYLGLTAAGMTYFVLQTAPAKVSEYHTTITFNPQGFIPNINFRGSASELLNTTEPAAHSDDAPQVEQPIVRPDPTRAAAPTAAQKLILEIQQPK